MSENQSALAENLKAPLILANEWENFGTRLCIYIRSRYNSWRYFSEEYDEDVEEAEEDEEPEVDGFDDERFKTVLRETIELFRALKERDKDKLEWKYMDILVQMGVFINDEFTVLPLKLLAFKRIAAHVAKTIADGKDLFADELRFEYFIDMENRLYTYNIKDGDMTDMLRLEQDLLDEDDHD